MLKISNVGLAQLVVIVLDGAVSFIDTPSR